MGSKDLDPRLQIGIGLLVVLSGIVIVGMGLLGIGQGNGILIGIPMLAVGAFVAKRGFDKLGGEED